MDCFFNVFREHTHVSLTGKILSRIKKKGGDDLVFTPADFLDLGTPQAVGMGLLRLERSGAIRRLARGLYEVPRHHPRIGQLSPSADAIARALAGRDRLRLQPTGAYAANLLRLSEQVPAKITYLTDASPRKVKVGNQTISLSKASTRRMAAAGRTSGLVFEALRYLGKAHVTTDRVASLRKLLSEKDRRQLLKDLTLAPVWMHPIIRFIAGAKAP